MSSYNDLSNLPLKKLLASGQAFETDIALSDLARLHDSLSRHDGVMRVSLTLEPSHRDKELLLTLHLKGELSVICQRCLSPYEAEFEVERTLLVENDDDQAPMTNDEPYERISASHLWTLDLFEVVTDELLLSMPRVHESACEDNLVTQYIVEQVAEQATSERY